MARIRQDNLQAFEQYKLRDDDAAPPALAPPLALPAPPAAQVINDEGQLVFFLRKGIRSRLVLFSTRILMDFDAGNLVLVLLISFFGMKKFW